MDARVLPRRVWRACIDALAAHVERGEVPGLVTLVSRRGEVHVDAIGTQSFGGSADAARHDLPHRLDDQADHRRGDDDPGRGVQAAARRAGRRLLPELADRQVLKRIDGPLDDTVPAQRPITVRDLLTFRMGFGAVMVSPAQVSDPAGRARTPASRPGRPSRDLHAPTSGCGGWARCR